MISTFLAALQRYLVDELGMKNVRYYIGDDYMVVADCYFYTRNRRGGRSWTFCQQKFTAKSSMAEAAQLVLAKLPELLVEKRDREAITERYRQANTINQCIAGTGMSVSASGSGFELQFKHDNKATVMAAIDYLQDGGFTGDYAPKTDDERFTLAQIHRIWAQLTPDQREAFLSDLGFSIDKE